MQKKVLFSEKTFANNILTTIKTSTYFFYIKKNLLQFSKANYT